MSMLEIYNETIRDLLDSNNGAAGSSSFGAGVGKLEVRQTSEGNVVPGLTEAMVRDCVPCTMLFHMRPYHRQNNRRR